MEGPQNGRAVPSLPTPLHFRGGVPPGLGLSYAGYEAGRSATSGFASHDAWSGLGATPVITVACARCTQSNHPANRYCELCGLPLGRAEADSSIGYDAIDVYEPPDPRDDHSDEQLRDLLTRSGYPASPTGRGWRVVVELPEARRQAVYLGHAGTDGDDQPILALVSVCGPVSERDLRTVLKLNARMIEGHFAVRTLRGEEYIVVIHNIRAEHVLRLDVERLVRRIAETADRLEEQLSRGRDVY